MTLYPTRVVFLIALLWMSVAPVHAQGLGGFINKAKEKVNQTTSGATQTTSQATQATEYQLPPNLPNDPSIAEMEEYARAMMADPRPLPKSEWGDSSDGNQYYRRLTKNEGYPIKFTWDQATMANFKKRQDGLMPYIDDLCDALVGQLQPYTERHTQLATALRKVKEIHLTSIPKPEKKGEPGEESGWYFSYNPATGVLTATSASSETYSGPTSLNGSGASFPKWIISHVR